MLTDEITQTPHALDVAAPKPGQPFVLYVTDTYCGWCHGFARTLQAFEQANHLSVPFRVISGGLFVGPRLAPISAYPHIPGANERISLLTGARFETAYQVLLAKGTFVMDSLQAAAGLAALREQDPVRGIHFSHLLQQAFYEGGLDLAQEATVLDIAASEGLDVDKVAGRLRSGQALAMAQADFGLARALGVSSYPTLLLVNGPLRHGLPATGTSLRTLNSKLGALLEL